MKKPTPHLILEVPYRRSSSYLGVGKLGVPLFQEQCSAWLWPLRPSVARMRMSCGGQLECGARGSE